MKPNMSHTDSLAQIDRLRGWRTRSPRLNLENEFRQARLGFDAVARSGQSIQQAWAGLAPNGLGERAAADRVTRGVLAVRVSNGADQHAAARWLRSGGALALSRAAGVPIRRWKFEQRPRA
ncbi:hypothetical protein AY599_13420 [Leptolyngbya valderiana BDU 20041]|nr:hypothetical protein AY599_13420 [Leptolyngbya valderiana BDU 20041]